MVVDVHEDVSFIPSFLHSFIHSISFHFNSIQFNSIQFIHSFFQFSSVQIQFNSIQWSIHFLQRIYLNSPLSSSPTIAISKLVPIAAMSYF